MAEPVKTKLSITDWALEDRPREKMLLKGISALSHAELIAILIGSGNREETAVQLSQRILDKAENNLHQLGKFSILELIDGFKGIGEAKAITIVAALELGRRRKIADVLDRKKIDSPDDAAQLFIAELGDLGHEEFWVIYLNRSNLILAREKTFQGGITESTVDVRLVIKRALDLKAVSVILGHNHPSGNLKPSPQDLQITQKIKNAAALFDIKCLDHIIVAANKHTSFSEEGLL
jgi:DNA repair protein RadC